MSFPGSQAYEHAAVLVTDLDAAREFCTDTLGLVEIASDDGVVYLGCGCDGRYDLALRAGGTGIEHFAMRVPSSESLDQAAAKLEAAGITTARRKNAEPGEADALRAELASGHVVELVVLDGPAEPLETYRPGRRPNAGAPLDADHVNLMTPDVRSLMDVLCELFDFRCSDVTEDPESGTCLAAWLRRGPGHHDVGIGTGPAGQTLHHVAWAYSSLEHMKLALDALSAAGHRLELGIGRHPVGANLFAYLWTPGGNRFELCAEGAILGDDTPTRTWSHMGETLNAWSDAPPPLSFATGS